MTLLKEYVEQVITELARDEKFIKSLKASRVRQSVPIANVEKLVDEWAMTQRNLKPNDIRLAKRYAIEQYVELYEKFRGDLGSTKRALFSALNGFMNKGTRK